MRRGIRFRQWWMLLMGILSILSGQGSLVGMERFTKRHRQMLNALLGADFEKSPSDSTVPRQPRWPFGVNQVGR